MYKSKIVFSISVPFICCSGLTPVNSVSAKNFQYENKFLELFFEKIRNNEILSFLDKNRLKKYKERFLETIIEKDKELKLLKSYKRFHTFIKNLNAVVEGKLEVINSLDYLFKAFNRDIIKLRNFLHDGKLDSKKDTNIFSNFVVNKIDKFIYDDIVGSHIFSIELHNILGGMYGKEKQVAFLDQMLEVSNLIIKGTVGKKKITSFLSNEKDTLEDITRILNIDSKSLFTICNFYKKLKNNLSAKEIEKEKLIKYLDEDEKQILTASKTSCISSFSVGLTNKSLLYSVAKNHVIKSIKNKKDYKIDDEFYSILARILKKTAKLSENKKSNRSKKLLRKKRAIFKIEKEHKKELKDKKYKFDNKIFDGVLKEKRTFFKVEKVDLSEKENGEIEKIEKVEDARNAKKIQKILDGSDFINKYLKMFVEKNYNNIDSNNK